MSYQALARKWRPRTFGELVGQEHVVRALSNALMSAGNTTDPTALRQYAVSLSPTQVGAPVFPAILPAPVPLLTLPSLTTMDRDPQNAVFSVLSGPLDP